MDVLGIDHLDLTATRLARSIPFYESVLSALGFSRVAHPTYTAWSNGKMTIGLREAAETERDVPFDRYRAGLHHVALRVLARDDVDRVHELLLASGVPVLDPPQEYPQYGPAYYAVFFADPDGIKLEVVHFPWGYWRRVQTDGHDARPRHARTGS
jgi:catechol 2,3-dioxygenase-like lactoylglutathione lyase family enzyme